MMFAAACSSGGSTAAPVSENPRLTPRHCDPPEGVTVTCHWMEVPENRHDSDGPTVRIAVAVLRSPSARPAPDPVVQVFGGPGGSGLAQLGFWAQSPILEHRDIVLFDQRGAGSSEPSLDCPERDAALARNLAQAEPYATELEVYRNALAACRERLVGAGVDLDQYDTEVVAADLADLRRALAVAQWNLYGISYGTRVALAAMRSHPEGIRSVVLDAAYPPGVGSLADVHGRALDSFERFFAACDDDPVCGSTYPELRDVVEGVVDRYNRMPVTATVDLGPAGGVAPVSVTGHDLQAAFTFMLASAALSAQLPAVVSRLAGGDVSDLPGLIARIVPSASTFSEGVQLGAECADNGEFPGTGPALADDPGASAAVLVHVAAPYCGLWDVEPLPRSFHHTVRSDVPTLVLAGSFDPVTPAEDGRATARALADARYVEIDGAGHGVSFEIPCAAALAAEFVSDPEPNALDTSCADDHVPTFTL